MNRHDSCGHHRLGLMIDRHLFGAVLLIWSTRETLEYMV
jgi:hypothetical protein